MSLNDIKNLYLGENIVTTRFQSKLDYNLGTVNINKIKNISVNGNAYIKREKLYENSIWYNTKPILHNSL